MSEKASKGKYLKPKKLQNRSNEEKGKEKKKERGKGKEEKKKKAMVALLVFKIVTFSAKGPFADNVIKNAATCILYF